MSVAAIVLSIVLGSCGARFAAPFDVPTTAAIDGVHDVAMGPIRIGGDHNYPPFEFINAARTPRMQR